MNRNDIEKRAKALAEQDPETRDAMSALARFVKETGYKLQRGAEDNLSFCKHGTLVGPQYPCWLCAAETLQTKRCKHGAEELYRDFGQGMQRVISCYWCDKEREINVPIYKIVHTRVVIPELLSEYQARTLEKELETHLFETFVIPSVEHGKTAIMLKSGIYSEAERLRDLMKGGEIYLSQDPECVAMSDEELIEYVKRNFYA